MRVLDVFVLKIKGQPRTMLTIDETVERGSVLRSAVGRWTVLGVESDLILRNGPRPPPISVLVSRCEGTSEYPIEGDELEVE